MAKRKVVPASAKDIRQAFADGKFTVSEKAAVSLTGSGPLGPRGRLHPEVIEAAAAAGLEYVPGSGVKTITLPVTKTSAKGAVLKRPVDVSLKEFRRLSGTTAGRPSASALAKAAEAYKAENGL